MLGGANLTMRGLSLQGYGNLELGTKLVPSDEDLKRMKVCKKMSFGLMMISTKQCKKSTLILRKTSKTLLSRFNQQITTI